MFFICKLMFLTSMIPGYGHYISALSMTYFSDFSDLTQNNFT